MHLSVLKLTNKNAVNSNRLLGKRVSRQSSNFFPRATQVPLSPRSQVYSSNAAGVQSRPPVIGLPFFLLPHPCNQSKTPHTRSTVWNIFHLTFIYNLCRGWTIVSTLLNVIQIDIIYTWLIGFGNAFLCSFYMIFRLNAALVTGDPLARPYSDI